MQLTAVPASSIRDAGAIPPQTPPPRVLRLQTDDLDEFRSFTETTQGPHSRVVHGSGPLGADLVFLRFGAFSVAACGMARPQTVRGSLSRPCLHIASAGRQRYRMGRRVLEVESGTAVFLPAQLEFTREAEPSVLISIECCDDALQGVRARSGTDSVKFAAAPRTLDTSPPLLAAQSALHGLLASASEVDASRLSGYAPLLLDVVAAAALTDDSAANLSAPGLRRLTRLEEWIDAHLDEPITVGRLCEVAGVGERTLQKHFFARHSMSPMRFVTERRLAAARRRLQCARAGDTVSQVAIAVGLTHFGRFSQLYRQVYGESPSRTLQDRPSSR